MSYLVDTCALSELVKPAPEPSVRAWFEAVPSDAPFVSALTLGEIRKAVQKLPPGPQRDRIGFCLEADLPAWFDQTIIAIDATVADEWGRLVALSIPTPPVIDSLLAATALRHRLSIVTRNMADFARTGVSIINPWNGP